MNSIFQKLSANLKNSGGVVGKKKGLLSFEEAVSKPKGG